jgi:acyl-CoA thioesterase I
MIMAVLLKWMLAAALVVAMAGCGNKEKALPVQTPEQTPVQTTAPPVPEQINDTRPVVAAFGDSLSAGLGLDAGQSYPDDLQRLIDAAGYRYRVVNMGVSGDTTSDGVERLPSVLAAHPAIVILEFGANDGLRGQPVALSQQNLAKMIEALQKNGAQIVLAGMTLPRNYGPEYIHAFEQIFPELAKQYKVVRIPFFLEGVGGVARLTQPDGLHPTAEGAAIVAHTVMQYLQPILKK